MPYTNLLTCDTLGVTGIKKLKICTQTTGGTAIVFPLNIVLTNDVDYNVEVHDDVINQIVTIGGNSYSYLIVDSVENCTYVDERTEARQGIFYTKTLTMDIPKMQAYTVNQLVSFLFNVGGSIAFANIFALIEDSNGNKWICGWDSPLIFQSGNLQTDVYDTTEDKITLTLISKSANRNYAYTNI